MGLFDKIKDNARDISIKAIESTREYDEDYAAAQTTAGTTVAPSELAAETATDEPATSQTAAGQADDSAPDPSLADEPAEDETAKKESETKDAKPAKPAADAKPVLARRSRIIEVPKDKKDAKPYRPFYKSSLPESTKPKEADKPKKSETPKAPARSIVIDVAPHRIQDRVKRAMYSRERAAMAALAGQRKLNGTISLYTTTHMNFKTRVFINRIEYSGSFGKNTLPIEQIAWVKLRAAGTGVILETTEGKRVVMVIKPKDRLAFAEAVLKVQELQPRKSKFKDTQTVRIDQLEKFGEGVDEIEKLAKLYDKGIITRDEFEAKKKQLLGI